MDTAKAANLYVHNTLSNARDLHLICSKVHRVQGRGPLRLHQRSCWQRATDHGSSAATHRGCVIRNGNRSFYLILSIAVPTTAGTGSETTGTAILDITSMSFKTGIANRAMKPTLGIVDTINTRSCSRELHISAGLDVLFHSLESYTAIP